MNPFTMNGSDVRKVGSIVTLSNGITSVLSPGSKFRSWGTKRPPKSSGGGTEAAPPRIGATGGPRLVIVPLKVSVVPGKPDWIGLASVNVIGSAIASLPRQKLKAKTLTDRKRNL